MNPTLQSAIRHLLTAVGVLVVEKGYASESLTTAIVGAIVALIGSVWGPLDEWIADRKAKRAAELELIRAQAAAAKFIAHVSQHGEHREHGVFPSAPSP